MTTAARPTFEAARGGSGKGENDLSALSKQYSSRDLPSHTKLKYREDGQTSQADIRGRDFRRELEEREERERSRRDKTDRGVIRDYGKRPRLDQIPVANLDADDPVDDEDEDADDDDDDDDTAELLAELQKIKKERAAEMSKMAMEKKAEEERIRTENILRGNPLINQAEASKPVDDFRVKRRWDDDVVFKNCAKGSDDGGRRFINDTLRSEFHKKFMEKYVK